MNTPVRTLVGGTGWGRMGHLPGFRHTPGAEVVAVYSTPLADARSAAEAFGIPAAYGDWQQALHETRPDLVTVALPPFQHAPVTLAAIELGCHVLCEKPMALHAGEAQQMVQAAEARGG